MSHFCWAMFFFFFSSMDSGAKFTSGLLVNVSFQLYDFQLFYTLKLYTSFRLCVNRYQSCFASFNTCFINQMQSNFVECPVTEWISSFFFFTMNFNRCVIERRCRRN